MSKSRVPVSWASRLILNKSLPVKPSHHHPISNSSQFLIRHHSCNQTRDFSVTPENSKQAIFQLLSEVEREKHAKQKAAIGIENGNLDDAFKWMAKLDKSEEKKQFPLYTTGGQLAKYTGTPACGNYNGVVGLAKARGLGVPITFQKALEKSFQTRMIHNLADKVKPLESPNAKVAGRWGSHSSYSNKAEETTQANFLRPLSPHLPIYKPQLNSTLSILNRVSGSFLAIIVTSFYLLYMKLGLVCLSFESFYQLLFYSSKLTLFSLEMAALAMVYHVVYGVKHLVADFSGKLGR